MSDCRAESFARPSGTNIFHQPDIRSTAIKHNGNHLSWLGLKLCEYRQLQPGQQTRGRPMADGPEAAQSSLAELCRDPQAAETQQPAFMMHGQAQSALPSKLPVCGVATDTAALHTLVPPHFSAPEQKALSRLGPQLQESLTGPLQLAPVCPVPPEASCHCHSAQQWEATASPPSSHTRPPSLCSLKST